MQMLVVVVIETRVATNGFTRFIVYTLCPHYVHLQCLQQFLASQINQQKSKECTSDFMCISIRIITCVSIIVIRIGIIIIIIRIPFFVTFL